MQTIRPGCKSDGDAISMSHKKTHMPIKTLEKMMLFGSPIVELASLRCRWGQGCSKNPVHCTGQQNNPYNANKTERGNNSSSPSHPHRKLAMASSAPAPPRKQVVVAAVKGPVKAPSSTPPAAAASQGQPPRGLSGSSGVAGAKGPSAAAGEPTAPSAQHGVGSAQQEPGAATSVATPLPTALSVSTCLGFRVNGAICERLAEGSFSPRKRWMMRPARRSAGRCPY